MTSIQTKPCARADKGCGGEVREQGRPARFQRRVFCSVRCAVQFRIEAGWQPARSLTREGRARGGARGGKIAALRNRKDSIMRATKPMERFLTPDFREGLSGEQLARVLVLIGRAYRIGHRVGYRAGWHAKAYRRKARMRSQKAA